jgi:hypothetical protein
MCGPGMRSVWGMRTGCEMLGFSGLPAGLGGIASYAARLFRGLRGHAHAPRHLRGKVPAGRLPPINGRRHPDFSQACRGPKSPANANEIVLTMHATDSAWRFWRETLKAPRFVCAPMVLQSELAFRMLVRRHGVDLCTWLLPIWRDRYPVKSVHCGCRLHPHDPSDFVSRARGYAWAGSPGVTAQARDELFFPQD